MVGQPAPRDQGILGHASSGFVLTLAFLWISVIEPGTYVRGLGFPVSLILILALPLRQVQVLGTSVIAFLLDWALWTLFIDSLTYVSERRRFRQRLSLAEKFALKSWQVKEI